MSAFQHPHDVTNAEFIRTYRSEDFPGGSLVQRLEDEIKRSRAHTVQKVVQAPTRSQAKDACCLVLRHFPDLYGYRGGLPEATEVYYLSPWEFLVLWEVRRLPAPPAGQKEEKIPPPLTVWLERPNAEENNPGHYVLNPEAETYFNDREDMLFYPVLDGYLQLRNLWYMVRRPRPIVPAPTGTPMPDGRASSEQRGKLFSVYLRPWVLEHSWATAGRVPHLTDLNMLRPTVHKEAEGVKKRRLLAKQPHPDAHVSSVDASTRSFSAAWTAYIRGGVVSRHAQRIIVQFMAACCGKTRKDQLNEDANEKLPRTCPPNEVKLARLHEIIDDLGVASAKTEPKKKTPQTKTAGEDDGENANDTETHPSNQMQNALHATSRLWKRDCSEWPLHDVDAANRGTSRLKGSYKPPTKESRGSRKRSAEDVHFSQKHAYVQLEEKRVEEWWKRVETSSKPPTAEQRRFLESVIARCRQEQEELNALGASSPDKRTRSLSESKRSMLLGMPGAGKSHCILLLRDFFESCMQWTDGVQFQFLAPQNSMAELIGGQTVHTWGVIPTNKTAAANKHGNKDVDWDQLFENVPSPTFQFFRVFDIFLALGASRTSRDDLAPKFL